MLYTKEQVINGLADYIDTEVMIKLPTSGKWLVGTVVALGVGNATAVMDSEAMKMLGVVDDNGMWDVDKLQKALKDSATKYGNLQVSLPIIGKMTFTPSDVDSIRRHIQ